MGPLWAAPPSAPSVSTLTQGWRVRCRGLEQALDQMEAERAAKSSTSAAAGPLSGGEFQVPDAAPSPRDTRKVMMKGRKAAAWRHLTLPERDALTVLTAICKARPARGRV